MLPRVDREGSVKEGIAGGGCPGDAGPPQGRRQWPFGGAPAGARRSRRSSPWRRCRYRIEYVLALASVWAIRALPERWALALGEGIAATLYLVMGRRRHVGSANLALAFPDWPEERRRATLLASFRNLGRSMVEFVRLAGGSRDALRARVRYEAGSLEILESHPGAIYFTAHFGNWELLPLAHSVFGHPMKLVVRTLDNPWLNRIVLALRTGAGNAVIERGKEEGGVHDLMEHLASGGNVGLMVDQYAHRRASVAVPFFGKKALCHRGPALMAQRTDAALIPCFIRRDPEKRGHFIIYVKPPLAVGKDAQGRNRLLRVTEMMQQAIEEEVRARPEEWLWMHRRWKRSEDAPQLYPLHGRRARRAKRKALLAPPLAEAEAGEAAQPSARGRDYFRPGA